MLSLVISSTIIIFTNISRLMTLKSVQFSSVAQSCLTLCDPMKCSISGLPVHHQLLKLAQTHVHWVSDAIQPAHPVLSPSPPAFNLPQHQGLFQWVSSSHQVANDYHELQIHVSFYTSIGCPTSTSHFFKTEFTFKFQTNFSYSFSKTGTCPRKIKFFNIFWSTHSFPYSYYLGTFSLPALSI